MSNLILIHPSSFIPHPFVLISPPDLPASFQRYCLLYLCSKPASPFLGSASSERLLSRRSLQPWRSSIQVLDADRADIGDHCLPINFALPAQ